MAPGSFWYSEYKILMGSPCEMCDGLLSYTLKFFAMREQKRNLLAVQCLPHSCSKQRKLGRQGKLKVRGWGSKILITSWHSPCLTWWGREVYSLNWCPKAQECVPVLTKESASTVKCAVKKIQSQL